ncbi:MAG: TIGR00730 family Rossman fold protein [Ignavibacteriales bacterium]|nr:TIGR00730 family Rossman fold protein [Ignavibacteriales bacterium]MCB9209434.1 TIGR00730 family Rossman fold protein [Ignavibacteriales bacterium]MCB9258077.1 TIGR00730 family Rossman fold protein [Ignavibacteriales bacterium]
MEKNNLPEKAYRNIDFLTSKDARIIRILSEFLEPQSRFKHYNIIDTIVFFGSARLRSKAEATKELRNYKKSNNQNKRGYDKEIKRLETLVKMSKYYEDAVELSEKLTKWSMQLPTNQKRFIVCSGGGPGIMEAANKGAKKAGGYSIGLNISIPYEQFVNKYVKKELAFEFHYFFMRKFWFAYLAKALVVFPGGFGTFDELMEILTLMQTGKIKKDMKVIVYDFDYWNKVINFESLIEYGLIDKDDLKLFDICSTVDEMFDKIVNYFEEHYLKKNM